MRILYIITQGEQGGGQKNVLDLALGMKAKGHEVYVAVGEIENNSDKWLHEELWKNSFKAENLLEIKILQREVNIKKDLSAIFEIKNLLKKLKPDVVHLHSSKAGVVGSVAGFLGGVKSVYTVHGFVFLEPMSIAKKYFYILLEFISSLFRNFTILISPVDVQAGKKFLILAPRGARWKIIYNGLSEKIREEILSREETRKFILEKIPPLPFGKMNAPIVGTISNLYKTKGLEYFIDAAKDVVSEKKDTIFVVFGGGEEKYKQELLESVKKNNLENNFFFLGKIPQAFKYLKALDVFTLTSVKEGLPYCLLEARLAGVPLVASSVGGIPEMAKSIEINLVQVKAVKQIQEKILRLLSGVQRTDNNLPQIYSLQNMLDETEKVYLQILS
jgi:glycosyltransferase involved in cell wall biosynthesis